MDTQKSEQHSLRISQEQLLTLVRTMIGGSVGREDDQNPLPPGPWDPVIRVALESVTVFGPRPEPWNAFSLTRSSLQNAASDVEQNSKFRDVVFAAILAKHPEIFDTIGGSPNFGDEVTLNPQPLPPRYAFLTGVAQAVIRRAELVQEIADSTVRDGSEQGIIIVSGYLGRFSDDWCPTGFKLRWPFPGPRPNWFAQELDGIDLMVMATQFDQAAKETASSELRGQLVNTAGKFAEMSVFRIQEDIDRGNYTGTRMGPTNASAV